MVVPIVAAAAARVVVTGAARAAATGAARAGAQATVRAGTQTAARGAVTGARATTQSAATAQKSNAVRESLGNINTPKAGGYSQNPAAEKNTLSVGRPAESRSAQGVRGDGTQSSTSGADTAADGEQESRTRDRRTRKTRTQQGQSGGEGETAYKQKFGALQLIGMLTVAILLDGIQIIAGLLVFGVVTGIFSYIVALLVNVAGWVLFGIWFALNGMSLFQGRKLVVSLAGFFADTILAGFVPNWTLTVVAAYSEERLKSSGIDIGGVVGKILK